MPVFILQPNLNDEANSKDDGDGKRATYVQVLVRAEGEVALLEEAVPVEEVHQQPTVQAVPATPGLLRHLKVVIQTGATAPRDVDEQQRLLRRRRITLLYQPPECWRQSRWAGSHWVLCQSLGCRKALKGRPTRASPTPAHHAKPAGPPRPSTTPSHKRAHGMAEKVAVALSGARRVGARGDSVSAVLREALAGRTGTAPCIVPKGGAACELLATEVSLESCVL